MTIGKRIKQLRQSKGLTMDALGEMFISVEKPEGLTKQTVSAWESGRNQLTAPQIHRICEIFGITADFLIFGKESAPKQSWPFTVPYRLYADMPDEEQRRLNNLVESTVHYWHTQNPQTKKKAS